MSKNHFSPLPNTVIGIPNSYGAAISAAIAIFIFLNKDLGKAMYYFTQLLGILMIASSEHGAMNIIVNGEKFFVTWEKLS